MNDVRPSPRCSLLSSPQGHILTVLHLALENLSRVIHRSVGRYPLNPKRKPAPGVTHTDPVGVATGRTTKQETRFHPYPEWRERMLQKCIASGRYGILTSSVRKAKPRPNTEVYELPQELQELLENEDVESEPESMMSDAEWEGWRSELEFTGPSLREPSFVTESDGLLRHRRREGTVVSGKGKALEGIIEWTKEHSVHPQRRPSPPSNSAPPSPRRSFSVPSHARSATLATSTVAPRQSSHCTDDANYDLITLLPNPSGAPENERLPGLGGGLGSYQPHTHTVTTISALRSADNEAVPKKGVARTWSNKGNRRGKTEDNPTRTSEESVIEGPPPTVDYRNDTWARSHNEGLDRLRHMSSPGLRQSGTQGGLLKSFLRDR